MKVVVYQWFLRESQQVLDRVLPWEPAVFILFFILILLVPGEQIERRFQYVVVEPDLFSFHQVPLFLPGTGEEHRDLLQINYAILMQGLL